MAFIIENLLLEVCGEKSFTYKIHVSKYTSKITGMGVLSVHSPMYLTE